MRRRNLFGFGFLIAIVCTLVLGRTFANSIEVTAKSNTIGANGEINVNWEKDAENDASGGTLSIYVEGNPNPIFSGSVKASGKKKIPYELSPFTKVTAKMTWANEQKGAATTKS